MFNRLLADTGNPRHLSHDNDPLFRFHRWTENLELLGIDEIWSVSYVPWSHPFVERLIGSVRRELLDRALFWNRSDLKQKPRNYQDYFNSARVHQGIGGTTPANLHAGTTSTKVSPEKLVWKSYCQGLFKVPMAA